MDTVDSFDGIDEDTVIRCPICNRRCQSEIDKYCKHFHASTWDGMWLYEGPLEETYEQAWNQTDTLCQEADTELCPDESLLEIWDALKDQDPSFWLEQTTNILIYNEGTMISGAGYLVFYEDPLLVEKLIDKLDAVSAWLKVVIRRNRLREQGIASIFMRYLKRRGKKR